MTEQDLLKKLFNLMEKRVGSISKDSYVKSLLVQGKVKINEKVLEEALELLEATNDVSVDKNKKIIHETADLWFHTMVLLLNEGIHIDDVLEELNNRLGISGHKEKSSRRFPVHGGGLISGKMNANSFFLGDPIRFIFSSIKLTNLLSS